VSSSSIQEVIVTNTGNARLTVQQPTISGENPGHFSVLNQDLPFELDFQQRDTLLVAFSPSSPGNKSAFLNILSNDPDESPFTVDIFGVGVRAELVIDMASYDFGNVALGSNESVTFTLTNTGTGSLSILGATLEGANAAEFLITSGGGATNIPPNNARTISVRFTPTSFGQKSATLRIANDVPGENPLDVPLTGTGFGQPDITVNRTVVAYNDVRVGTTSIQEIVIVNTGLATLIVTDAQYGGNNADLFASQPGSFPMELEPTGRDTLRIAFTPLSGGNKSATASLISNDPDENPLEIFLTGDGVRPGLVVDVTSHDFGEVASGTVATTDFSISNTGTSNLILSLTEIRGTNATDFAIVGGGGAATVAPNTTRVITVAFMPMTPGAKSATLHIESDDNSVPVLDLRLSGSGSSIGVDVESPAASGQDVVVGITLPPGFTASRAQLFYRLAGETIYREAAMSIAGSELIGRIPSSITSPRAMTTPRSRSPPSLRRRRLSFCRS
jgi:hypothetical protein